VQSITTCSLKVLDEIKDNPFDFIGLSSLQEINISSFGSAPKRHLHALCKLLSVRESAVHSGSGFTIEIVRLHMRCGSTTIRTAGMLFDPGWDELDRILTGSPPFRRLKIVEIHIGLTINCTQHDGSEEDGKDIRDLKTNMSPAISNSFSRQRQSNSLLS
jgi:hypothetical protein